VLEKLSNHVGLTLNKHSSYATILYTETAEANSVLK